MCKKIHSLIKKPHSTAKWGENTLVGTPKMTTHDSAISKPWNMQIGRGVSVLHPSSICKSAVLEQFAAFKLDGPVELHYFRKISNCKISTIYIQHQLIRHLCIEQSSCIKKTGVCLIVFGGAAVRCVIKWCQLLYYTKLLHEILHAIGALYVCLLTKIPLYPHLHTSDFFFSSQPPPFTKPPVFLSHMAPLK